MFGTDGLVSELRARNWVIDCSTISPLRTQEFAAGLSERGVGWIDAPVSGGSEGAQRATLTFMVGGDDENVTRAYPVLNAMGTTITHAGPLGRDNGPRQ